MTCLLLHIHSSIDIIILGELNTSDVKICLLLYFVSILLLNEEHPFGMYTPPPTDVSSPVNQTIGLDC